MPLPIMFINEGDTLARLEGVGYFTDREIATAIYAAGKLQRPILLEGPAGAGKTEMALAVQRATGMKLIRLQCYEGLTDKEAVGDTSESLRQLYTLMHKGSFEEAAEKISDRVFFAPGPLVRALESPERCILLIDEIDKISHAFEAVLLEFLNDWQSTVPSLGIAIKATFPPFTIVTANDERELGFPLLRRCIRVYINHPTPEKEAEIIANRTPNCSKDIHHFIAGFAKTLRGFPMQKPPSISEMITLALALDLLKVKEIKDEHKSIILPFIAKTAKDRATLLIPGRFEQFMDNARIVAQELKNEYMKKLASGAADFAAAAEQSPALTLPGTPALPPSLQAAPRLLEVANQ